LRTNLQNSHKTAQTYVNSVVPVFYQEWVETLEQGQICQ